MTIRLSVLLLLSLGVSAADTVYRAPSPEPTAEETLLLRLINRCRADPQAEGLRLAPPSVRDVIRLHIPPNVDVAMFRAEMAKISPAPPLVFDLRLIEAARKHAHYMILNELGHVEAVGKPGFTGIAFTDRLAAVGWTGRGGENCFRDSPTAEISHLGFVVDMGPGGPGGMQPGRGHRVNICNPSFNKVGVGALPHNEPLPGYDSTENRYSVVHNFGGDGRRYVGGAAFVDRDRNADYSIGEGRGGIAVSVGDAKAVTWSSGAYVIEIPATACTLQLRSADQERRISIPAGTTNVAIDWSIPQPDQLAATDKLIASATAAEDAASQTGRKTRVALAISVMGIDFDDVRAARVQALCGDLGDRILADRVRVRELMDGDPKEFKSALTEAQKHWRGTAAADWFGGCETVMRARTAVDGLAAGKATPTAARSLAKELRAQALKTIAPEFRSELDALADRAMAAADSPKR